MAPDDPVEAFARRYLAAKLDEVDAALASLDRSPDALEEHAARERLVAFRVQIVAALADAQSDGDSSRVQ